MEQEGRIIVHYIIATYTLVVGIRNGSRAHIDIVCFVMSRQYCSSLQQRNTKEKDFFASWVYYGGTGRIYTGVEWWKGHRTYVASLKLKNPNGIASNLRVGV